MIRRIGLGLGLLAMLAGCTLGPDYRRPELDPPEEYQQPTESQESLANLPWWEVFEDPALQELIQTALEHNKDLQAAYWRVEEARARLGFTKADLWPTFDYFAGAGVDNPSIATPPLPGDKVENYNAGIGISWEIDLWGKLRRSNEAARAELLGTEWGRRALTLSLVSEVSRLYFRLRDFDSRLETSQETLQARQEATELIRKRFKGGVVSELDVRQAEIQEATAAVSVPLFERNVVQTENALSVLLGREPGPIVRGLSIFDQEFPEELPAGLPSELLQRRPDIRQTEELLHAQMARIGVAQALRFPQLNLTGAFGIESNELSDFATSGAGFWNIGLDLFGPLFQFGKNKRRVEVERYRTEQAILGYENAVLEAFREVEDSLIGIRTRREEYLAREEQVASARAAYELSWARYDGGVTSYLEVLDIQRSLFNAELQASFTRAAHHIAIVSLYGALGGGWDPLEVYIPEPKVPGNEPKD